MRESDIYDKDKYQLAYRTHSSVNNLFSRTKSSIKKEERANVVYKIKCDGDKSNLCDKVYVGTIKTKLKTRLSSYKSDIKACTRPLEQKTALAAHCALTGHKPNFDDVDILAEERHYNRRYTLEMLHIVDVPAEKRLNYKTDTHGCSHLYRHILSKNKCKRDSRGGRTVVTNDL